MSSSVTEEIRKELFALQDKEYRNFQSKLIPGCDIGHMIGVRTPQLRSLAKRYEKREDIRSFLAELPHEYFDENQLHAFILSGMKDFELCINELETFLPFVDNWATCDQMSPKIFKKHRKELLVHIERWLRSDKTYTVRFAIGMLMEHFLDEEFGPEYPEMVSKAVSSEYYVNMMKAWYFATALAKQYDASVIYIEEKRLDSWTHNKAIQKAVESYRISPEKKEYLKSLRVKKS